VRVGGNIDVRARVLWQWTENDKNLEEKARLLWKDKFKVEDPGQSLQVFRKAILKAMAPMLPWIMVSPLEYVSLRR
jgi:hypothetical protein